jgi:hypothetical protein
MYRSKHQKGYITSHQVKTTRFRTWKSGKKWIYGASVLTLAVSTLLPVGNLAFLPKSENVQAATTPANGALTAGGTADTGDHTYDSTAIQTNGNWSPGGTSAWSGNWINFTTMSTSTWSTGYAYFTGASSMSFSSGFTLSGNFKAQKTIKLLIQMRREILTKRSQIRTTMPEMKIWLMEHGQMGLIIKIQQLRQLEIQ